MEFICTICLINKKQKGHIMCSFCKKDFEESVLESLESKKTPETLFQYAERMTQKNLNNYKAEYEALKNSLDAFWDQSCKEIKRDCKGIKLSKDNFLRAVRTRYKKLLEKAGQLKDFDKMEEHKKTIRNLQGQLNWFAKIKQQKQARAEKNAVA